MSRVKRGVTAHARHRKVIEASKGFRGRSSTCFRSAIEQLEKSMQRAYRDRRNRRRDLRQLWIVRINAAVRERGMSYSRFLNACKKANIVVNRKMLADLAVNDKEAFDVVFEAATK